MSALMTSLLPVAMLAQSAPAEACVRIDDELPVALQGWASRDTPADMQLPIGQARTARLEPVAAIAFASPPERAPAAGSFGKMLRFTVEHAGSYRVALGARAWIDVVKDSKPIASTAHGHGPRCSSIRKMVSFDLAPGTYVLQLSGADAPGITVLVAPAE